MSAIKDGRYPIFLDKKRHLLFSLNAIDAVQDKCGDIEKLGDLLSGKDSFKNIRWLLTLLINEGRDDDDEVLSEEKVGRLINTNNLSEVTRTITKAFSFGSTGVEDVSVNEEEYEAEEEKNAKAGKGV